MNTAWAVLPLAAAAGVASSFHNSAFAAADTAVAVLGIEASEGAPDALASALTDALRQRVSSTKGFRLVPGRDLVEVKLVFSCPDEAPSCMAQAGKSLGAAKLIFGSVKRSVGDNYVVTLKLLDTTRGIVDTWVAEQITKAQASGAALRGPVQKWFATLTGQGGAGIVRVRGDVIGASVALDGAPSGIIGTEDLVIAGVTPGKHDVTVTKPGYEPAHKEVVVASGETSQVDVTLPRSSAPPPPVATPTPGLPGPVRADEPSRAEGRESEGKPGLKAATWAVLGAGVVGLALAVKFGVNVEQINTKLDPYRRFPCPGQAANTTGCNAQEMPVPPLNPGEVNYVKLERDDGHRLETYQYIAYGVGGALVVAGGYLFYRAYLEDDGERAPSRGLSLAPILLPGQAGLAAHLRF